MSQGLQLIVQVAKIANISWKNNIKCYIANEIAKVIIKVLSWQLQGVLHETIHVFFFFLIGKFFVPIGKPKTFHKPSSSLYHLSQTSRAKMNNHETIHVTQGAFV